MLKLRDPAYRIGEDEQPVLAVVAICRRVAVAVYRLGMTAIDHKSQPRPVLEGAQHRCRR